MSEQPHFDPSAQIGAVDPTLQGGNTQFTLAECPLDTMTALDTYMSTRHGNTEMRLESGVSLAEQCNANYSSLNERGISMSQYVGVLETAEATAKSMNGGQNGTEDIPLDDSRISHEIVGHREFLSGERHPLSGELIPSTTNTFATKAREGVLTTDREEEMGMLDGFADLEVEMARLGVFTARRGYEGATCRADEILDRLAATQTGLGILEANGIVAGGRGAVGRERSERPIALVPTVEASAPEPAQIAEVPNQRQVEAKAQPKQQLARRMLGRVGLGRRVRR